MEDKNSLVSIENIKYANFGYNKNLIKGEVFGKNFKLKVDDNYKKINFKLIDTGVNADINFNEREKNNLQSGVFKSKILNTNFKSDFVYDGKTVKVNNSYFRSKNISFKNNSDIILKPFLDINSKFFIEEFNTQLLRNLDLNQLLKFKTFLKKINNKNKINYKFKKFNRKYFDDLYLKINLAYGRMNYSKKLFNEKDILQCGGYINFLDEYPKLFFDCYLKTKNKKEFFKKMSLKTKSKNKIFELKFKGNLSILNNKINFKGISVNENYDASKEDLKYFKETFENILFDNNFFEIFDLKKLKQFIVEIS